ncbi:20924_t:CDS:2, partial [Gigaspora margarita]
QSIVISHKDGKWGPEEIYRTKKTSIQLGTYDQQEIAVKHFNDKMNVNKIIRELRKHRHLRNADVKNVIKFHGVVRKPNDRICIVMEYAKNGNLQDYLSRNYLDWNFKSQWIIEVSRGLLTCHEHGIVHLDLRARNIFVDYNLTLKIADFGFKSLKWASPEYVSDEEKMKEYFKDQPDLSDIYSYGLVAWEILMNGK